MPIEKAQLQARVVNQFVDAKIKSAKFLNVRLCCLTFYLKRYLFNKRKAIIFKSYRKAQYVYSF